MSTFLGQLELTDHGRYGQYINSFLMVAVKGQARNDKWRMLDADRPPKGIAKNAKGETFSLRGMGEFKNIAHQSRIFHCTCPGGLFVLLDFYTEKKEDDLTAEAINPALRAREEFFRRRDQRLSARGGTQ